MFRQIFAQIEAVAPQTGQLLLEWHPSELTMLVERVWSQRAQRNAAPTPTDGIPIFQQSISGIGPIAAVQNYLYDPGQIALPHMIYAYLIENTRVYEIFQRVLHAFIHGEKFGFPQQASQRWLRATEELFYKDTPHWLINSITSYIRPDLRATRRNAYMRMFGFDLNHGTGNSVNYPYEKPAEVNTGFKDMLVLFLREVYRGLINRRNLIGSNDTSNEAIATAARRLGEMLRTRRQEGNLSREEFFAVATMSWFHVVLDINVPNDAPIILDMHAEAESAADRLKIIGERVGYPVHPKSDDFFMLAENMSALLIFIENGIFDAAAQAQDLYMDPFYSNLMEQIITHWDSATDGRIKATEVTMQQKRYAAVQGSVGVSTQSSAGVPVR